MSETQEKTKLKTEENSCPNCGGKIVFNPSKQMLECPYCFSVFEVAKESGENTIVKEKALGELLANTQVWNSAEVVQCENCGSKEVISKGQMATHCSFCGTTNIVKTSEIIGMTPHGICPFEKTVEEASAAATSWAKGKFFAPNNFKKSAKAEAIKGVYSSAFTFDCDTCTHYTGVLGERRTETRTRFGKTESYSYTRYFDISGNYDRKFDDLLVYSSANITPLMMGKLEPFPTMAALPYTEKYLAGFTANTYCKDGKQTWEDCKQRVSSIVKREILRGYHYDVVEKFNADTSYFDTSFKYLLLPTYVGHYTYKGKNYNFYVNGSTGKVAGKAPVSGWKVAFTVLGIAAAIALAVLLF